MSQPIRVPVPVTIASGVATATFPSPPMGTVWTGSISVPNATSGTILNVTWQAATGGAPLSGWFNAQPSGSVQVASGDTITIVGTGLAAGTYTAWLIGVQDPAAAAPAVWPQPPPPPPAAGPLTLYADPFGVQVGAGTTVRLDAVPVVLGQSVAISLLVQSEIRLSLSWETGATFFYDVQQNLNGLIVQNLGSLLTLSLTVATGFPAVTTQLTVASGDFGSSKSPGVPTGLLWYYNASTPVNGGDTIYLPPYCGQASMWVEPNNVPGVGITVIGSNYEGSDVWESRIGGASSGPGPQFDSQSILLLPAMILRVFITNNSSATQTISTSGTALTP